MKQIQHTALRKKVSCYHYLIKSSDNLKPFLQLFNNRSKNSLTSIGDGMNCTFEHICSNS